MVRSLRKRPRPDTLVSDKRRITNRAGRYVYLALLAVFLAMLVDYLAGDRVFLRAHGLVLRDRVAIAATYIARVESVAVTAGQQVDAGEPVLILRSTEMLERLADLSARHAVLVARESDFRIRAAIVSQLLPLARKREDETSRVMGRFDALANSGLATAAGYDAALSAGFDARQARVRLAAEEHSLRRELVALATARDDAERVLADLIDLYANGRVDAPVTGAVGAKVPVPGEVFRPGDPILSIYSGEAYVLAYLPHRYLFSLAVGQRVRVSSGRGAADGEIVEILPVTDALPTEFQNTFRPRDRSQLARIRFTGRPPFPLHEKVEVGLAYF